MAEWQEDNLSSILEYPFDFDRYIEEQLRQIDEKLYLKDLEGKERYQYTSYTTLTDFTEKSYEQIQAEHGEHIKQKDTDDIVENEVKFFVWARPEDWAFSVVPVYRKEKRLFLGKEEVFYFENDGWVQNFFDGMK